MSSQIESKKELEIIKNVENDKYQSVDDKEFENMQETLKKASLNTNRKTLKTKSYKYTTFRERYREVKSDGFT